MLIGLFASPLISIIACLGMLFLVSSFFNNNNNFMFNFGQAEAISFPLRNIENFKSIDLAGDAANGTNSLTINTNALTGDGNCEICQLITFTPGPSGHAGIAYRSNNALDLTGAQRIVFFAKGELGGENLAFVAVGKDKTSGQTSNTSSASPKIFKTLTFAVTTQNVTLVNDWKRYQISLNGIDLTGVTAPFGIIVQKDRHQTPPSSPGNNRPPLDDKDPNHIVFFLKGVTIDNNLAVDPLPVVTNTAKGATSPAAAIANTTTAPAAIANTTTAPTGTPVQNTSPRIPTTTTQSPTTNGAGPLAASAGANTTTAPAAIANTTTAPTGTPVQNTSPRIPTTTTQSPTTTTQSPTTTTQSPTTTTPSLQSQPRSQPSYPYPYPYPYQGQLSPYQSQQPQQQQQPQPQQPINQQPPIANAGISQTVYGGTIVTLDGRASYDPDNYAAGGYANHYINNYGIAAYQWTQIPTTTTSGVQTPAVILQGANTATPTFVAPILPYDTILAFSLKVIDSDGRTISSNPAIVNVYVKHNPNNNSPTTGGSNSNTPGTAVNQQQQLVSPNNNLVPYPSQPSAFPTLPPQIGSPNALSIFPSGR
jgi:hypothetical protein